MTKGRMPVLHAKDTLAMKFRQNWLAQHPTDTGLNEKGLDDSLTSLSWLHNLNIMKIATPTPPPSPEPLLESASDMRVNPNSVLNMTHMCATIKSEPKLLTADLAPPPSVPMDQIDYKTNPYVKPPFSYATLICMAMKESKKSKITLSAIYNWITENFIYYRIADPSWQNSIRHNLSLNKCFQKVPRRKDEPGKGGFWRINPEYNDMLENGIFKKRRGSNRENLIPPKRIKTEPVEDIPPTPHLVKIKTEPGLEHSCSSRLHHPGEEDDSATFKGDFTWHSLLNQDIEVNGIKIKTETIIDETDKTETCPIIAMSPPPSDLSEDGFEDILGSDLSADLPDGLDFQNNPLDLTVTGFSIRPPQWWSESMTQDIMMSPSHSSGLNTPIAPSPVPDSICPQHHPWADDAKDLDEAMNEALAAFDVDSLFSMGNISNTCL